MEYSFSIYRQSSNSPEHEGTGWSTRYLSLSMKRSAESPAPLLFLMFQGSAGIKGQIAAKMAADVAVQRALDCFQQESAVSQRSRDEVRARNIAREAFREANARVYDYSHVMGAGGQMAASGFLAVFDGVQLAAVRVGDAQAYIFRRKMLTTLFEDTKPSLAPGMLTRFVGANAQVLADVSTFVVCDGDVVFIVPHSIEVSELSKLQACADRGSAGPAVLRSAQEVSLSSGSELSAVIVAGRT